jgi:hypothetical protein
MELWSTPCSVCLLCCPAHVLNLPAHWLAYPMGDCVLCFLVCLLTLSLGSWPAAGVSYSLSMESVQQAQQLFVAAPGASKGKKVGLLPLTKRVSLKRVEAGPLPTPVVLHETLQPGGTSSDIFVVPRPGAVAKGAAGTPASRIEQKKVRGGVVVRCGATGGRIKDQG